MGAWLLNRVLSFSCLEVCDHTFCWCNNYWLKIVHNNHLIVVVDFFWIVSIHILIRINNLKNLAFWRLRGHRTWALYDPPLINLCLLNLMAWLLLSYDQSYMPNCFCFIYLISYWSLFLCENWAISVFMLLSISKICFSSFGLSNYRRSMLEVQESEQKHFYLLF